MSSDTLKIIVPSKFLALMLHLIAVTMNYFSYHDNILTTYPNVTTRTDTLYTGAVAAFMVCNSLTLLFLAIEIIILFSGRTMFRDNHNIIHATFHFIGAIFYISYQFQQWNYYIIWALWAPFSLIPLIMEILVLISVFSK